MRQRGIGDTFDDSGFLIVVALVISLYVVCAVLSGIAGITRKYLAAWIVGTVGILPIVLVSCVALSSQTALVKYSISIRNVYLSVGAGSCDSGMDNEPQAKKRNGN